MHVIGAAQPHPRYPHRFDVPDELVPWAKEWGEYAPDEYTHPSLVENDRSKKEGGWADPPDPKAIGRGDCVDAKTGKRVPGWDDPSRASELVKQHDLCPEMGAPRNPRGRTGLSGRGLLGKWGPNHAADPIVTRWREVEGERVLEMVAVQRADTGEWAIPGGMVEAGQVVSAQVKKEFEEECFAGDSKEHGEENKKRLEWIFHRGVEVYRGYVDDPRNTDHAWMETTAMHFHISSPELADALKLGSGDSADVKRVTWLAMDPIHEPKYAALYASHRELTDRVRERLIGHKQSGEAYLERASPLFVKEAQRVRESQVSWLVEKSDYAPVFFNDPDTVVTSDGDPVKGADAPDIDGALLEELKHKRQTYEGDVEFIELHPSRPDQTAPRNPRGRTGIAGRGTLYKWGPNHATDSIVTRYHPATGVLQFAAVWRKLDGKWAIPGHLVREGQEPGVPVKVREAFENEALSHAKREPEKTSKILTMLDELFDVKKGVPVYKGYVDDPRNTDNAWIETTAYSFHCSLELGGLLKLQTVAADLAPTSQRASIVSVISGRSPSRFSKSSRSTADAPNDSGARWVTIVNDEGFFKQLYGAHGSIGSRPKPHTSHRTSCYRATGTARTARSSSLCTRRTSSSGSRGYCRPWSSGGRPSSCGA